MKSTRFALLICFVFATVCRAHVAADEMAAAAEKFLAALDAQQRAKATFEFKDDQRSDWYFIPKVRKG